MLLVPLGQCAGLFSTLQHRPTSALMLQFAANISLVVASGLVPLAALSEALEEVRPRWCDLSATNLDVWDAAGDDVMDSPESLSLVLQAVRPNDGSEDTKKPKPAKAARMPKMPVLAGKQAEAKQDPTHRPHLRICCGFWWCQMWTCAEQLGSLLDLCASSGL